MSDWQFCEHILGEVSRTFSLNIRVLRGDLHRTVLLSYLWCRIIDTVEDAANLNGSQKSESLLAFRQLFLGKDLDAEKLDAWQGQLNNCEGTPSELSLLKRAADVAECFNQIPQQKRMAVMPHIAEMARGMAQYSLRQTSQGAVFLKDEEDLDQYCYFVAGTVGELLTNLFLLEMGPDHRAAKNLKELAVSFGLALQVTNITKDVMVDLQRGWSYVPQSFLDNAGLSREQFIACEKPHAQAEVIHLMVQKAKSHLQDALNYTLYIPKSQRRIRLFCLWPLFMAVETMVMMQSEQFRYQAGYSPKITRKQVKSIVSKTSAFFWSNWWLKTAFEKAWSS